MTVREAWRTYQAPGFWKGLAETRDAQLAKHPQRPVGPHDACRQQSLKYLLAWCPPCATRRIKRARVSRYVNIRDVAEQLIATHSGLCRIHLVVKCKQGWCDAQHNP